MADTTPPVILYQSVRPSVPEAIIGVVDWGTQGALDDASHGTVFSFESRPLGTTAWAGYATGPPYSTISPAVAGTEYRFRIDANRGYPQVFSNVIRVGADGHSQQTEWPDAVIVHDATGAVLGQPGIYVQTWGPDHVPLHYVFRWRRSGSDDAWTYGTLDSAVRYLDLTDAHVDAHREFQLVTYDESVQHYSNVVQLGVPLVAVGTNRNRFDNAWPILTDGTPVDNVLHLVNPPDYQISNVWTFTAPASGIVTVSLAGSDLTGPPPDPTPLLSSMIAWWDPDSYSGSGKLLNLGVGGPAFDLDTGTALFTTVDGFRCFEVGGANGVLTCTAALTIATTDDITIGFITVPTVLGNPFKMFGATGDDGSGLWVANARDWQGGTNNTRQAFGYLKDTTGALIGAGDAGGGSYDLMVEAPRGALITVGRSVATHKIVETIRTYVADDQAADISTGPFTLTHWSVGYPNFEYPGGGDLGGADTPWSNGRGFLNDPYPTPGQVIGCPFNFFAGFVHKGTLTADQLALIADHYSRLYHG